MDQDRRLCIRLELDLHDGEVRGRALCDQAEPRDFVGWMGLLSVLDALVEPEPQAPPGRS